MRKLVYYVAASIDGYIADETGDPSVFPLQPQTLADLFTRYPETCPQHLRQPLGVTAAPRRFDTVIMGYRTHEPALKAGLTSAYPHLRQIVATHRELPDDPTVEVWSGDLAPRIAELKRQAGGDIWLCGGSKLASQLIEHIDELQIKLNPITLGSGTPLFAAANLHSWRLKASEQIPGNVCLLSYESNR